MLTMSNIIITDEDTSIEVRIPPERMAWGILLLAFTAFCLILASSILLVNYFLFQSSLSLESSLKVGRGTARISASTQPIQAETGQRYLSNEMTVSTDAQDPWSQSVITFNDHSLLTYPIANITLMNDTTLHLKRANRPRFSWSTTIYEISIQDFMGELEIHIHDELPRPINMVITSASGDEVIINRSGRYTVSASNAQLTLVTHRGEAIVLSSDSLIVSSIPAGQQALLDNQTGSLIREPSPINLLSNSQLQVFDPDSQSQPQNLTSSPPHGWVCTNGPTNNLPLGNYLEDYAPDGRLAFRMIRTNADTNGYTRCQQNFGEDGLDLTAYDSLILQAVFYVNYQSLKGCGQEGSECPMMFRIHYKLFPSDDDDDTIDWIHGVYTVPLTQFEEQQGWKRQCSTCLQSHVSIQDHTWYIYESGNLFDVIPDGRRPGVITQVEFFAEGHQYDVFIDELSLLARVADS
jgi:hypothetical protein